MTTSFARDQLAAIEWAAVRSWPAVESREISGWLARSSSGGSVRANSVSALAWTGSDMDLAFTDVERFYGERGAPVRYTITEVSAPDGLDAKLAARGYERVGDHVTMAKRATRLFASAPPSIGLQVAESPSTGWYDVYLAGVTPDRRHVAPRIVESVPRPRFFIAALRDGQVIASGLTVHDGPCASVQCMATRADARRSGAARAVLAEIERIAVAAGRNTLYLQADAENIAAIRLYESVGFSLAGRYHSRVRQT